MEKQEKPLIEMIIEDSIKQLSKVYNEQSRCTRLIFPLYSNRKEKRISEQEIRFLFVREIEKYNEYYYAVEAPTCKKYRFSDNSAPIIDKNGQSGNLDICLYEKDGNKYKEKHLIEFKALNPQLNSYSKDFLKLLRDQDKLINYFIQIIKTDNKKCIINIIKKYEKSLQIALDKKEADLSKLIIYLYNLTEKKITVYTSEDRKVIKLETIFV